MSRKSVASKFIKRNDGRPPLEPLPLDPRSEMMKAHARKGARARENRTKGKHDQA